jgi:hypothetical protein
MVEAASESRVFSRAMPRETEEQPAAVETRLASHLIGGGLGDVVQE